FGPKTAGFASIEASALLGWEEISFSLPVTFPWGSSFDKKGYFASSRLGNSQCLADHERAGQEEEQDHRVQRDAEDVQGKEIARVEGEHEDAERDHAGRDGPA